MTGRLMLLAVALSVGLPTAILLAVTQGGAW